MIRVINFNGGRVGKTLRRAFGDVCMSWMYEEVAPRVGNYCGDNTPVDRNHVKKVIDVARPKVILALGKVAQDTLSSVCCPCEIVHAPHPSARMNTVDPLRVAGHRIQELMLEMEYGKDGYG